MNDMNLQIALAYKIPRVTKFIDEDIRLIKKLNQVLMRLERNGKEKYILECMNIIRQLDNVFFINKLYPVLCELVDIRFHSTILLMHEKIQCPDQYIRKLQELADDETE